MHALLRASGVIDRMNERIGKSVAWLGLAAVIVCTGNAVARYALNIGSNAWLETAVVFQLRGVPADRGVRAQRNEHVRIDVINGRLSPRTQAWIDILGGCSCCCRRCIIIALVQLAVARQFVRDQEYSSDPGGLIRWPVRLLIPVAFALLGLQGVSELIKRVAFLKGLLPASEFEKKGHAT